MNIAVCDDEVICGDRILEICRKLSVDNKVLCFGFSSGEELIRSKEAIDLLFLDIEMPGVDGIRVKNYLEKYRYRTKIVFTTSHEERMIEAFGQNVIGFLTKPVTEKSVEAFFHKALCALSANMVEWEEAGKYYSVYTDDIDYVEAQDKYTRLVCEQGEYLVRRTLNVWEQCLPAEDFCKINRSLLLNLRLFDKTGNVIRLKDGKKVPISRKMKQNIIDKYKAYIRKRACEL